MEEIKACRFAFDANDEDCKSCDGLDPDCGGYEVEEVEIEQSTDKALEAPNTAESVQPSNDPTQEQLGPSQAAVRVIRAESGVSCEIQSKWYKFFYSEERHLPEGEIDLENERKHLWETVNAEVDNQMLETYEQMTK